MEEFKRMFDRYNRLPVQYIYIHPNDNPNPDNITHNFIIDLYNKETNYHNKRYLLMSCYSLYMRLDMRQGILVGGDDIKHKLQKYSYKYNENNDSKYSEKYYHYLKKYKNYDFNYIPQLVQMGGNYTRYQRFVPLIANDNLQEEDLINIDCESLNQNESCMKNYAPTIINRQTYKLENNLYYFKRYFKGISTDTFMEFLHENIIQYSNITYFVYIHLNLCLSHLIYILNKTYGYNINEEIKLIYKGGNTTRIHLGVIARKYNIANIENQYDNTNIGDWDYSINIDYESLYKKNIDIDLLLLKITKVIGFGLSYIKIMLPNYLHIDDIYLNKIINKIVDINTVSSINSYIETNNLYNNDNIHSININRILVGNYANHIICHNNGQLECNINRVQTDRPNKKSFTMHQL